MGNFTKKYLTIDDLLSFCMQSKLDNFSAKDAGGPIIVQSFGKIKTEDTTTMGLTPCTLMACHTELNRNKSFIEESVMNNALASFSNRPILGYIHQLEDGTWNFWDHRMSIEEDGDETRIEYLESPIGVIPESCNAHLEYDEEHDKNYVVVNGFLYDDYGNRAIEIIQENGGNVDVSVELAINSMSYNAKENYLNIEDFTFMGVTCLGKTPDGTIVHPGMEGANLKLDNFSATQNSMFSNDCQNKMIEILEKLNDTLSNFNTNIQKGGNVKMNTFEILLEKYGKTVEDVTFDTEGLSDEELEAKFKEAFEDAEGDNGVSDNSADDGADDGSDDETDSNDDGSSDDTDNNDDTDGDVGEPEKFTKTFTVELSHEDVRYALYNLIRVYEEEDNEWYSIRSGYGNYFYMKGWCNNKLYKIGYTVDGENVALEGDRQEMFEIIVSESEKLAIEKLREDYSALEVQYNELKAFKETYDASVIKAQKTEILDKAEYECLADNADFAQLKSDMDKFSVEEVSTKADLIFAAHMKSKMEFSAKDDGKKTPKVIGFSADTKTEKKKKAYGKLFD